MSSATSPQAGSTAGPELKAAEEDKQKEKDKEQEDEEIVIHVFDENRKVKKDFKCRRSVLLANMKYFEAYLTDEDSADDIDISVHCDIKIFDWLMKYIENPAAQTKDNLDIKNVISVLISAEFLKMPTLLETCICYVAVNLGDVV